jgi:hypothetical protein
MLNLATYHLHLTTFMDMRRIPEQIKQQIDAVKSDKSVPEAQKKEDLEQLDTALKSAKPIQFKDNIALVLKYYDKLTELMQG